jgi:hypothetical protein
MLKLAVTAARYHKIPAILAQEAEHFTHFHRVILWHQNGDTAPAARSRLTFRLNGRLSAPYTGQFIHTGRSNRC